MDYYSINSITLCGSVYKVSVKDVYGEDRANKKKVARVTIQTGQVFGAQRKVQRTYIQAVAWGARAEFIEKHVKPGNIVAVQGSLQCNTYQDKEGKRSYDWHVLSNSFVLMTEFKPKPEADAAGQAGEGDSLPPGGKDPMEQKNPFDL
jgi:single-stranded DNA-binding protein